MSTVNIFDAPAPAPVRVSTGGFTLRDYQQEAVDRAVEYLRAKHTHNGLLVLPTGSGKSLVVAGIIKALGEPTLVLQPSKEILWQNVEKFRSYGGRCGIYSASAGVKRLDDVTFATIGSVIRKLDKLERFKYVIVDECFPAGTLIDGRPIEQVREGDTVNSYNHDTGRIEKKRVIRTMRKHPGNRLVRVSLSNGGAFICTPNHPVYVPTKGYVRADSLRGESVYFKHGKADAEEVLCGVQRRLQQHDKGGSNAVLQQGMRGGIPIRSEEVGTHRVRQVQSPGRADGVQPDELHTYRPGVLLEGVWPFGPKGSPDKGIDGSQEGSAIPGERILSHEVSQPNVDAGREREDGGSNAWTYIPFTRRERGVDPSPNDDALGYGASDGICDPNGGGKRRSTIVAASLQGGLGRPGNEAGNRGGWQVAQAEEVDLSGSPEDHRIERVGVASVEVYERGSGREFEQVCPGGVVYNLEVEDNHNYFANGTLVHNCDLINSAGGMYEELITTLGVKVMGLTATPYRLSRQTDMKTGMSQAILKFLTRTRPAVFSHVVYHVQNGRLFADGHLCRLVYYAVDTINRGNLQKNSTGADYTDESVKAEYARTGFEQKIVKVVNRLFEVGRRNCLVFTRFVREAELVASMIPGAVVVSAETKPADRDRIIGGFRSGRIRCVVNVGVLTVGFDYPELEAVVMARPTMSLRLWYQVVGRGVRPHPNKDHTMVIDMGGNLAQFGKVEDLVLKQEGGWAVWSGERQLTNVPFGDKFRAKR